MKEKFPEITERKMNSVIKKIRALDNANLKKNLNEGKNEETNHITIKNIFGEKQEIPYKSLEAISFEFVTGKIQKKSETSIFSKLGYILLKKFKPKKIFYLNKV